MKVLILGASAKPGRYSYRALKMLQEYGHQVLPVHPALEDIEGIPVTNSLIDVNEKVDTVTVYLNPQRLSNLADDLIAIKPKRIILNPGTESAELTKKFTEAGISVQQACTLVLLRTGQFD